MRVEELGLSAFVAGTAIGYLIWYWARGGKEEKSEVAENAKPGQAPEPSVAAADAKQPPAQNAKADQAPKVPAGESKQPRPLFQTATVLACGFLLLALFIGMGFDAHPMGPARFVTLNHWLISIAVLILIILLARLLWSAWRRRGASARYGDVFEATLSVVFGFVLALFVVVLVWGPHWLYLDPAYSWIVAAPLGALLLGIVFGSIGGEWLDYIMHEDRLKTVAMQRQHRSWGFVLLALLFLGILYPFFPGLISKISSANVTTPIGGVAFSTQPISTIRQQEGPTPIGNEASETPIWPGFDAFERMSARDGQYADLFFRKEKGKLAAINRLHDGGDPASQNGANDFAKNVLNPLGKCVNAYFDQFKNRGLIQRRFDDAIISYTKLLHPAKPTGRVDASGLLTELSKATEALNKDMRSSREVAEPKEPCEEARKKIEAARNANPSLPTTLPYPAMGLAFLLYDSGETEQAMREIASWVEDHYRNTAQEKLAECNDKKKAIDEASCAYYGYRPKVEEGEPATWEQLPPWYRIRIEFELTEMLAPTVNRRVAYFTAHELVHTIESLFTGSDIKSPYDWASCELRMKNSAKLSKPENSKDSDEDLESRMVAAYFSLVDKMLRNLTSVADQGLLDGDAAISPEMLTYAAKNSLAPLHCLSYYQGRADVLETYNGEYKATYGILLVQAILLHNSPMSEFERAARKEEMTNANVALRHAIPILKQQVDKHDRDLSVKRFDERLFALLEERDYLRRATVALKSLEELER
jgi:hypothetical protein